MKSRTSRILIEMMVKRTLKEMKISPERSIRNLVDMAVRFANGRFQQHFLESVQTILQNERSPYYPLMQDIVTHVDEAKLLTLGMNIGYNSFIQGAKNIRSIEHEQHFNIPWTIALHIKNQTFWQDPERYYQIIEQGTHLGIFTWILFADKQPWELLSLVSEHPDSAFALFCTPEDVNSLLLDSVADLNNLMLVVRFDENAGEACELLRKNKLPYSVYFPYTELDVRLITSGELFHSTEVLYPAFTILLSKPGCPENARQEVYATVKQVRNEQFYQTIPWEMAYDNCFIDSVISEDSCSAGFDESGNLYTLYDYKPQSCYNVFANDLAQILKCAFPKKEVSENEA